MSKPVSELLKKMGIVAHDETLYVEALTHSSHNGACMNAKHFDYWKEAYMFYWNVEHEGVAI